MSNVKDILKKINKDRLEKDHLKLWADVSDKSPVYCSTGSFYLDYKLTKGLGINMKHMTMIVGSEGSGKTSLALSIAKNAIEKTGKIVIYLDGEGTTDISYIDRVGIPEDKFLRVGGSCLEDMLDIAEDFSKAEDVCAIIIDSIPIFFSKTVEMKNAEENSIGVEAKRFNARMPIIIGNTIARNILLIPLTYYKLNPGAIGADPRTLPRGEWQKYMNSNLLELSRKEFIKDSNGTVTGQTIRFRIKKNKAGSFDPKEVFEIDYYFNGGFDNVSDKVKILLANGVITQGGAWFQYPNGEKFQGLPKTVDFARDNESYLNTLFDDNN